MTPPCALLGQVLVLGIFPAALSVAIATDLMSRIIPNLVIGVLILGFSVLALSTGVPDLKPRLLWCAGVLAVGLALFRADLVGAGDAKLAAAVVPWLDPGQVVIFLLLCGLLGAGLVGLALSRARLAAPFAAVSGLPYGVALAGAALLLFPFSALMALAA